MVINGELLQARKKVSNKRPKFVRQESWRYDRLAESWRKPKGKDNKMRRQLSGMPRLVKVGYRGPKKARGLHPSGYTDNLIFNVRDLDRLDPSRDAARIAHAVGQRKRILILAEARSKGIKVLNPGREQKSEAATESKTELSANERVETKDQSKELGPSAEGDDEESEDGELDDEVEEDDSGNLEAEGTSNQNIDAKADNKLQQKDTEESRDQQPTARNKE
jgi:large subunit ribosomal protein L32e